MENIKTNRIKLQISEMPQRYFFISILILFIIVLSVFATGYFFRFSDQYSDMRIITNKDVQGENLVTNSNNQFIKNLPLKGSLRIYLLNGKSKFLGYGSINKKANEQLVLIKIENKVLNILNQKFKSADSIEIKLQYNGPKKSIFSRIFDDQNKRQATNEKPTNN